LAVNKKTVVGGEKSKRGGVKMTPSGVLVLRHGEGCSEARDMV